MGSIIKAGAKIVGKGVLGGGSSWIGWNIGEKIWK